MVSTSTGASSDWGAVSVAGGCCDGWVSGEGCRVESVSEATIESNKCTF